MDRGQILRLTVEGLKENLERLGLETTGRKATLQDRLLEHFGLNASDDEDAEFDDAGSRRSLPVPAAERSMFTLRDIEDSMTLFSGSGQPTFEQWLTDFEENAAAVQWSELQKYIYGKQLLKGAAKMFVRSRTGVSCWSSLRLALQEEFGAALSSIEVHRA